MKPAYVRISAVVVAAGAIGILAFGLIQSDFIWQEIDSLTTQSLDNEHDYSLFIHNDFTNDNTFEIINEKK